MLKLIRADLFRLFHRIYFYVLLGALAGLAVIVNIAIANVNSYAFVSFSWGFVLSFLMVPLFLMPMLSDIVLAEEYREHTLKNTVANGVNRLELYLSKTVTTVVLGLLLAVVAVGAYCASSLILLGRDPQFTDQFVREFFLRVGAACTVYIAGMTLSNLLAVLLKRNSLFVFVYYAAVFFTQYLFKLLRVPQLNDYLLVSQITVVSGKPVAQLQGALVISAITAVVCIICGLVFFRRQNVD